MRIVGHIKTRLSARLSDISIHIEALRHSASLLEILTTRYGASHKEEEDSIKLQDGTFTYEKRQYPFENLGVATRGWSAEVFGPTSVAHALLGDFISQIDSAGILDVKLSSATRKERITTKCKAQLDIDPRSLFNPKLTQLVAQFAPLAKEEGCAIVIHPIRAQFQLMSLPQKETLVKASSDFAELLEAIRPMQWQKTFTIRVNSVEDFRSHIFAVEAGLDMEQTEQALRALEEALK